MTLAFDPDDYDYGPASPAIRQILRDWGAIDWFVPSSASDDELIHLFAAHNALAYRYAPELFAREVSLRVELGGWPAFVAWCARVRDGAATWDWKYGALKTLCRAHAQAHGWKLDDEAHRVQPLGGQRPGDLFFNVQNTTGKPFLIWNTTALPGLSDGALADKEDNESAQFFFEYARHDAFHAIEWELATPPAPDANPFRPLVATASNENPFVRLLDCYRAGACPFSLGRDEVVLFRFAADEGVLPPARVL